MIKALDHNAVFGGGEVYLEFPFFHRAFLLYAFSIYGRNTAPQMCESSSLEHSSGNSEGQDKLDSVWSNPDKSGHPLQKEKPFTKAVNGIEKMTGKMPSKTPQFRLAVAHFLIITGSKRACCPIINQEKPGQARSNPSKIGQRTTDFLERKKPGKPHGSGLFEHF